MQKLDRLDWAEGLALSAYGVSVGLRISVPGTLPRLLHLLPPGWKKSERAVVGRLYSLVIGDTSQRVGVHRLHVLYADTVRVARSAELNVVTEAFETDLHRYIAETSSKMTFLHAGVVGWQGKAIIIPGRSLSGKTTLVRELLRSGATYYSDEFAVIDDHALVHAFARPLHIRGDDSYAVTRYTAESLGATTGFSPLRVSILLFTEFMKGARFQPTVLSRGQGTLELLANSFGVRRRPRQTLSRVHKLARQALFFRGPRGHAREAAGLILGLSGQQQLEMV